MTIEEIKNLKENQVIFVYIVSLNGKIKLERHNLIINSNGYKLSGQSLNTNNLLSDKYVLEYNNTTKYKYIKHALSEFSEYDMKLYFNVLKERYSKKYPELFMF